MPVVDFDGYLSWGIVEIACDDYNVSVWCTCGEYRDMFFAVGDVTNDFAPSGDRKSVV